MNLGAKRFVENRVDLPVVATPQPESGQFLWTAVLDTVAFKDGAG